MERVRGADVPYDEMKTLLTLFMSSLSFAAIGDTITGWDVVGDDGTDASIFQMCRRVDEKPCVVLAIYTIDNGRIKGTIVSSFKGELNINDRVMCELPPNLHPVKERYNEPLSEMYILAGSIREVRSGEYVLDDCIVVPRTKTPFLPEVALRLALHHKFPDKSPFRHGRSE